MMAYRALTFFDLDGTLLDAHSQVTPEVADAMQQLKQNDILPIIATGRTEPEVRHIMEAAKIESDIVMNGAFIRVNGTEIHSDRLDPELCRNVYEAVLENGDQLSYYNENNIWCTGYNDELINAYQFIHSQIPPIDPLAFEKYPVNMLLVLGKNNEGFYEERFPELNFFRNTPYSLDTVKKSVSKGNAVTILKQAMNLENVPTYGFGDGPNDLALLQACDTKIAMANGAPVLKEIADFVTKKNTEGGILHALRHFDLL
ncbi:Cof-type HAD-IIB family hydrolase [Enterococcus songbeiensis]